MSTLVTGLGPPFDVTPRRYIVPLAFGAPNLLGFSSCSIAPGLEIRQTMGDDENVLNELNIVYAETLRMMHTAPSRISSHVIEIDERAYFNYVENKIYAEYGKNSEKMYFNVDDIYKMIIISTCLFKLWPMHTSQYYIIENCENNFKYFGFIKPAAQLLWESWHHFAMSRSYDLTKEGLITCSDLVRSVNSLEKYYRHNYWIGNRMAVSLHNFWNVLVSRDVTIAFLSLVSIIETFTNLSKERDDPVAEQVYRNTPKLVPVNGHGENVTREMLEKIYDARSVIVHGSYGWDGPRTVDWHTTHIDAKFANIDARLSTSALSIVAGLLNRVLFDPEIMEIVENSKSTKQERRRLRKYLNAMPDHTTAAQSE